jgi:hypothetical protein
MTPVDPRITTAGLTVSLDTLVTVYIDHWRGIPAAMVCPACGHRFPPDNTRAQCPTTAVVGPLILRRRNEDPTALRPLTRDQWLYLVDHRETPLEHRQPRSQHPQDELFPINPPRPARGGLL